MRLAGLSSAIDEDRIGRIYQTHPSKSFQQYRPKTDMEPLACHKARPRWRQFHKFRYANSSDLCLLWEPDSDIGTLADHLDSERFRSAPRTG